MYTSVKEFLNARDALLLKTNVLLAIGALEFTEVELEHVRVYRQHLKSLDFVYTEETVSAAVLPELTLPQLAKYIYPERYVKRTLEETVIAAAQERLDLFCQAKGYDGILSACTYATSSVPKFAIEGQAAVIARDATWAKLYAILGEVQAGTRPMPTSYADIEPELPVLEWPQ